MKKSDLKRIKEDYDFYRTLLFNDDIPDSSQVNFTLHSLIFAAGYSKYNEKPLRNGAHHTIAFCKWFKMDEKLVKEILIHEMIHVWQAWHVKEDRYRACTNNIAHDRVFMCKMTTINLILRKECMDLVIDDTCKEHLHFDDFVTEADKKKLAKKYGEGVVKKCE